MLTHGNLSGKMYMLTILRNIFTTNWFLARLRFDETVSWAILVIKINKLSELSKAPLDSHQTCTPTEVSVDQFFELGFCVYHFKNS